MANKKVPGHAKRGLCKDNPRFMGWFQPVADLNSEIDMETIKTGGRVRKLKYLFEGEVCSTTPSSLLKSKDIKEIPRASSKYWGSADAFMRWFKDSADLNPDFDPEKVSLSVSCAIKYHVDEAKINTITVGGLFRNRDFSRCNENTTIAGTTKTYEKEGDKYGK